MTVANDDGAKPEQDKLLPRLRRKYGWLDHLIRANDAFTERY
ncbi:inner membrane protein YhjD, partial [Amycolatopsis lurida]